MRLPSILNLRGSTQSALLKRNILASFMLKGVSILISFFIVPLTIDFVNPTQYGIWLTLSSLLAWFSFFDIGLSLGFRNRFAQAKAKGEFRLAREYVSTTYATLFVLAMAMLAITLTVNHFLDWSSILKVDPSYGSELSQVFAIMITFFGINLVAQTFSSMVTADQHPAISSAIQVSGQAIAIILIFALTRSAAPGSLVTLSLIYSGAPVAMLLLATAVMFATSYRAYAPSISAIRPRLIKSILGIGGQFFIITTSMLFIFQLMNVIISRNIGPDAVTEYNIAYKYLNSVYMIAVLILNPFWSAFTDAYTRGNLEWMRRMLRRLEMLWLVAIPLVGILLLAAPWFYSIWIGRSVTVSPSISVSVAVYTLLLMLANIYMYLINGTGKVRIQLIIYLTFAIISYPIMNFSCARWGIPGLLIVPATVYLCQALLGRIQLHRLINNTATGLWDK